MDTENTKNLNEKPEMIEQSDETKSEEKKLEEIKLEDSKIDSTTVPAKQSSASKFVHITKKKNIVVHTMSKNDHKKRFDSSDYYMKKHNEKKS